ncbi:MAG: ATP-binding protein [Thermodesulfobacteriota bacterium]
MAMNLVIRKIREASLKNKMFFSSLTVILLLSFVIALFTRWVLISSLTAELVMRGRGIAERVADSSRGYILTEDIPELTHLIFDARLGLRESLVAYIFIVDARKKLMAHTFMEEFPAGLRNANEIPPRASYSTKLVTVAGISAYDIAMPIREGIYEIGNVHVGIKKEHIDRLIGKLRTTFVGFLSFITIFFFAISHMLSRYITRPISQLTEISNEICRSQAMAGLDRDGCPLPEHYSGDEVMQLAHSFNNMTAQLSRSQKELKESEGKYRSLFNSGPIPIFVLDRKTLEILDANPSAEETYGYPKGELLGKFFTDFGQFEYEEKNLRKTVENGWPDGYTLTENVRYYRKGDRRPQYIRFKACPAEYKGREALILAATDITEMVEKDAQLIQASKMSTLGEMSAGVAHELNQPLNAIKLGNEYLKTMLQQKRAIPEEDLLQVATEVNNQVMRASEIISRLRAFGRKTDFAKERVDINAPVQGVLRMIGRQLELANIAVEMDLNRDLPEIMAHNNRLEQVLFNLITNAMDAINREKDAADTKDKRIIRIRTFRNANRVSLTVEDSGIGIPESIRGKIFEPFFTTKEVGKGMGLGLSIIYGIVKDYNGDISVESREGFGTVFNLSFPAAP